MAQKVTEIKPKCLCVIFGQNVQGKIFELKQSEVFPSENFRFKVDLH